DEEIHLIWRKEAEERLSRLPYFLQKMIKGRVERHAREAGIGFITLELMEELRKKTFGNTAPIFKDGRFQGLSMPVDNRNTL
ncbi:MAG TPA: PCP reductase family protein, partial [Nitrospiria bacterium]|nr:PCP reductase family protein [Nitrospiria bacterium]